MLSYKIYWFNASLTLHPKFLSYYCVDNNRLSGSIPTEVGLLTELTDLNFGKQLFAG